MIAVIKGLYLLHLSGVASGLLAVPLGIVLLGVVIMVSVLTREWLRRRRCPHNDVRMVRQHHHGRFYFVEICMACRKTAGGPPPGDGPYS